MRADISSGAGLRRPPPDLCAVVLAAGVGQRLRPLTGIRPKALCPVGNVPLLDLALNRVEALGLRGPADVAVNASWLAEQVDAHVDGRAHVSVEPGGPLGTAGGVARLRDWVAGRAVLVGNADAYLAGGDLAALLDGWDGTTVRLLGVPTRPDDPYRFGVHRFAGFSLLPWSTVEPLPPVATGGRPAELVREVWRPAERAGRLAVIEYAGTYLDTGTPRDYLAANLHAAGGDSLLAPRALVRGRVDRAVLGAGAVVDGSATRTVVWPDGYVGPSEDLRDAIRVGRELTVPALSSSTGR
jgi:N-acetyl-alpha-D-muramate 1-phosphate uridylyltransferase